eukprot:5772317-Pyramimonas_sp.AAC.1
MAVGAADFDHLSIPLQHECYNKLMIEAARHARNAIALRKPQCLQARYFVMRSCARAVFRQDIHLAGRLTLTHKLAREHLLLDMVAGSV